MRALLPAMLALACASPAGVALRIEPAEPTSSDDLMAVLEAGDLDAERLVVVWWRDGERAAAPGFVVPASATRRGEVWRATVERLRPGPFGGALAMAEVVVGNSAPRIGSLRLDPADPRADDAVEAIASGVHDEDGDDVSIEVRWFADGAAVHEGPELPPGAALAGQRIEAVAVPFDAFEAGEEASVRAGPLRPAYPDAGRWTGGWGQGCHLDDEGRAWCWKTEGTVADGFFVGAPRPFGGELRFVEIAGSSGSYGVDVDGGLWVWGWIQTGPSDSERYDAPVSVPIPGAGRLVSVSAASTAACVVDETGGVYCWGHSRFGILPTAGQGDWHEPALRFPELRLARVDLGPEHACGVDFDGGGWCWGREYRKRLGAAGLQPENHEPVRVEGDRRWRRVVPGRSHTCGLDSGRRAWCWGYSAFGQHGTGLGPGDPGPSQVFGRQRWLTLAPADQSTCAVRDDHGLWCWGDDRADMVLFPDANRSDLPHETGAPHRWISLMANPFDACAQREDGSRWCWGQKLWPSDGPDGQMVRLPDPSDGE